MPTDTEAPRPIYTTRFVGPTGQTESYSTPALTPFELSMAALNWLNHSPRDFASYDQWVAAVEEANAFATFCVGETLDDETGMCDPRRSFSDLWSKFIG